jgi:exosome complex RNA-binding protein Csl4
MTRNLKSTNLTSSKNDFGVTLSLCTKTRDTLL